MAEPSSSRRARTWARSAKNPDRGRASNLAGGQAPGVVVTGRPSAFHFSNPPSSTAAPSNPNARSIHHTRVAHMMLPAL